jgi:L-iditol 2-dehydrogenase
MMKTMKAAVLHGIGDMRVEQTPVPQLAAPEDILVRVKAVGICGSDIHFFEDGRIGTYVVEKPIVLGHELAGEVVEVGPDVKDLKPGDRVALEPGVPCRKCSFCKSGRYNLCATVPFMGTPPTDGAFREYITWPADFAFRLPDNASWEEGAMIEPLAVGVQACQRAQVAGGHTVAVLGCGPIGLTALQAAACFGATKIIATDVIPSRLALAEQLGAGIVVNAARSDPVHAVMAATGGNGVDVALETAGTAQTVRQACAMVRRGGVVVLVGMHSQDEFAIPVMDVICREYDLRGVFRYCNAFGPAIAMLAANRVQLKPLLTQVFPLDQINAAFDLARKHKDTSIKVQIHP